MVAVTEISQLMATAPGYQAPHDDPFDLDGGGYTLDDLTLLELDGGGYMEAP